MKGLPLEALGVEMGRAPEQLSDWLCGRHIPCRHNQKYVELSEICAAFDMAKNSTVSSAAEGIIKDVRLRQDIDMLKRLLDKSQRRT